MKSADKSQLADSEDFRKVRQAAVYLQGQACTLAARHISDGTLRLQFNRDIAYYMRGIVRDVEDGRRSVEDGLKAIEDEKHSLLIQSKDLGLKFAGLGAGVLQVGAGVGICYGSFGTLCLTAGAALILHGGNNIYENGRNLYEGRSDTEGPIRKGYQSLATFSGKQPCAGNVAYGAVDLALSAYGLYGLTLKPDAWKLFNYVRADKIRGYEDIAPLSFSIERTADVASGISIWDNWKCLYE